jgi:hypothetical protein
MKANELKEILRKLITEEVKNEVQRQLPKLLFEMVGAQNKTVIQENVMPNSVPTKVDKSSYLSTPQPIPQKRPMKRYVKDPVLNQILNETTPGLPQTTYGSGIDLEGQGFAKIGVSDQFMGEMKEICNGNVESSQPDEQIVEESSGPDLSKLFSKNFKAILDKSKERGNCGNFTSKALQSW